MITVFLSASIPLPERDKQFVETVDVMLIREAVKALVVSLIECRGRLIFGGHPAITPLIATLFDDFAFDPTEFVTLYQSDYFDGLFPPENARFGSVVRVPAVRADREGSLFQMRRRMLSDKAIDKGVFIGGMEGVLEEFEMFQARYGLENAMPIASTGAAAKLIFDRHPNIDSALSSEITYLTLFRDKFNCRSAD